MDKILMLRIRGTDEIDDILQLPLVHLHTRFLCDAVLVDSSEVDGECLTYILESGRRYGEGEPTLSASEGMTGPSFDPVIPSLALRVS